MLSFAEKEASLGAGGGASPVSRGAHSKGVCRLVCESPSYTPSFLLFPRGTHHHMSKKVSVPSRLKRRTTLPQEI